MTAFYNEIDPQAAQHLRNLIDAGHIAPGVVDERSIEDVRPDELMGYEQCHFFAGVGVWSYALRRAGVPDHARVWTGSCPCQPFSTAGEGAGFADERHLWPAFFHLIEQCGPGLVLGEQVASVDADPWIDLVCADLERLGYAVGASAFPAAGVGAPHLRDRLYWVANTPGTRLEGIGPGRNPRPGRQGTAVERGGEDGGMANADGQRFGEAGQCELSPGRAERPECSGDAGRLADSAGRGFGEFGSALVAGDVRHADGGGHASGGVGDSECIGPQGSSYAASGARVGEARTQPAGAGSDGRPGPVNGHWRAADWLFCRDGFWRPVEPGTFPLAYGAPARVGRLRAYGNGLCAEAAQVFIECVREVLAS